MNHKRSKKPRSSAARDINDDSVSLNSFAASPKRRSQKSNETDINRDLIDAENKKPARPVDEKRLRSRTMQRAANLLAAKPRSIGELRARLLEKQWATEDAVDYALDKLKQHGYLNDAAFAEQFASSRVRQKPVGRSRVALDLSRKQIDRETASQALDKVFEETPEGDLLDEAITRYTRTKGAPQDRAAQKRLYDYLMRRGFSYDLIQKRVRAASEATDDE